MDNETNFETYLYVSLKKLAITVNKKSNFEKVYEKEVLFENEVNQINLNQLNYFLDQNILKIEKLFKFFIKNVYLIINCNDFLPIQISVKKNNYGEFLTLSSLSYVLNEAKDQCKITSRDKEIIHIVIDNYQIDNNDYSVLPENIKCDNFSLDVSFICLSNNLIRDLEKVLKKYQVSVNQIISSSYIEKFFTKENQDIFSISKKIIDGFNENEVVLVDKSKQNQGFFEKFFNFFS